MAVIGNWVVPEHIREQMINFEEEEDCRITAKDDAYIHGWRLLGMHVADIMGSPTWGTDR
jgi:hypothetical protein